MSINLDIKCPLIELTFPAPGLILLRSFNTLLVDINSLIAVFDPLGQTINSRRFPSSVNRVANSNSGKE